jgi:transcription initiation factor IIE alpha subunit
VWLRKDRRGSRAAINELIWRKITFLCVFPVFRGTSRHMTVLVKLAEAMGRRDEVPNQELAQEIILSVRHSRNRLRRLYE